MKSDPTDVARLRKEADGIFQAALKAVDPKKAVQRTLRVEKDRLKILQGKRLVTSIYLKKIAKIFLVGAGKASTVMGQAVEEILGDRLASGVIVTKTDHALPLKKTRLIEAAHPIPDIAGLEAARITAETLIQAQEDDLVISIISGGGSALWPLPVDGLSLEEKQTVNRLLLNSGATIHEINAVRKHISKIKGGQAAFLAAPATVINLILSDVVGDDLDTIASGPFVPDPSTFSDATAVLKKYDLWEKVPFSIQNHLAGGLKGRLSETPKTGHPCFHRVINLIVGSNRLALEAAAVTARAHGYRPLILTSTLEGETREAAKFHVAVAREVRSSGHPLKPPACLISGGETTVTIRGPGLGGRNQEFALAAALELEGLKDILIFSAGTDGTDGPTSAAGAMSDQTTVQRANLAGLCPRAHLERNDAYPFFTALGDLVITGPTLTNVMDIHLVLIP